MKDTWSIRVVHPWRKALIALAIAMIPVYIGFYLAHKQQKADTVESAPTGNASQGHGASF
jgi:hypothetical protein